MATREMVALMVELMAEQRSQRNQETVHAIGIILQIIAQTGGKTASVTRNVILEPADLTGETVGRSSQRNH